MALVIFSGWEWGFIDAVSANNNEGTHDGSPTIVSGAWAGSSFSLRVNAVGAATADYNFSGLGPLGNLVSTNTPTSFHRLDFKYEVKPASGDEAIIRLDNVNAVHAKMYLTLTSAGNLRIRDQALNILQTGSTVLAQSTKYTLYFMCGTGNPAPYEVRINSSTATPELSGTGDMLGTGGGEIRIGKGTSLNNQTIDFYYDNYCWRDDAYPPPGICVMLIPFADGFYINGLANGAAQLWQCVNEIPSDGDTSYINGLTIGQAYTAKVALSPALAGTVNYVASLYSAKRDGGVSTATGLRLRSGTTDSDTATTQPTLGPNYNVFRKLFETDPATGLPWTVAGVNAAQVGVVQTDANPARMSSAFIMVDYQPGTPFRQVSLTGDPNSFQILGSK